MAADGGGTAASGNLAPVPPTGTSLVASGGLVVTAFFWGSMVPMTHWLLRAGLDPFLLPALRYAIALPALAGFCWLLERRWPYGGRLPLWRLTLLGSLGMAGFSICYTFGILFSNPVTAAVILTASPLVAVVMARLLYRTPLERGLGLSLSLAVGGGLLVIAGAPAAGGPVGLQGGEGLLLVGMACWAWYSMKAQEWLVPLGMSQIRITTLTGTASALALALVFSGMAAAGLAANPGSGPIGPLEVGLLVWIGLGCTGLATVLWNFGAGRIGVPVASLHLNLVPVFAVGLAALIGAPITLLQVLGGALVLAGVLQMQLPRAMAKTR